MLVRILRSFPYAVDGIRARELAAGSVEDVLDDLVPGLTAEGFVRAPSAEELDGSPPSPAAAPSPAVAPSQVEILGEADDPADGAEGDETATEPPAEAPVKRPRRARKS